MKPITGRIMAGLLTTMAALAGPASAADVWQIDPVHSAPAAKP